MPIITIYQGASVEGAALAESIAEHLGYRCIGRELLVEASGHYGIPHAKLTEVVEKNLHWWEWFQQDVQPYRTALQASLCELAQDSKVVYHGHLGHELLSGIGHVLKVLLTAPMELRIKEVQARQHLTEAAARQQIDELDKARSRRLLAMFGADWRDPSRYDLTLNTINLSREGAKRLITEAASLPEYQITPVSDQAFKDLALAARAHATLFAAPNLIRGSGVEVRAERGHVYVSGRVAHGLEQKVIRLIKTVSGVIDVTSDLYSAPPEGFLQL